MIFISIQAGLTASTKEEILASLQERVEAGDQQLEEALETIIQGLRTFNLLTPDEQSTDIPLVARPSQDGARYTESYTGSSDDCFLQGMQQQKPPQEKYLDWEIFLTGKFYNKPLPQVPLLHRGYALWKTITLLFSICCYRIVSHLFHQLHIQKQRQGLQAHE